MPIAEEEPVVAHVALALQLSPGVHIDSVSYEISGGGLAPPITGAVDVREPGATISLMFRGIPPGSGYSLELSALSNDGGTSCAGSAPFSIFEGSITEIMMTLHCRSLSEPATGGVSVTTNNCPVVSMAIGPILVGVGGTISMTASAIDPDPDTTLTYTWSTTGGGTFADLHATSTTFICTPAGSQTIRVTVTDGLCSQFQQIAVSCAGISVGGT